jgi:hypothetical protein
LFFGLAPNTNALSTAAAVHIADANNIPIELPLAAARLALVTDSRWLACFDISTF